MQSGKASSRTRSRRSGHNSELPVGEKLSRISPRRSFRVVIGEFNREFTVNIPRLINHVIGILLVTWVLLSVGHVNDDDVADFRDRWRDRSHAHHHNQLAG